MVSEREFDKLTNICFVVRDQWLIFSMFVKCSTPFLMWLPSRGLFWSFRRLEVLIGSGELGRFNGKGSWKNLSWASNLICYIVHSRAARESLRKYLLLMAVWMADWIWNVEPRSAFRSPKTKNETGCNFIIGIAINQYLIKHRDNCADHRGRADRCDSGGIGIWAFSSISNAGFKRLDMIWGSPSNFGVNLINACLKS